MLSVMQNFLLAIVLLLIMFLVGHLFLHTVQWEKSTTAAFAWGFIVIVAIFHIIAYPLYLFKASFSVLLWSFSIVLFTVLVIAVIVAVRQHAMRMIKADISTVWQGIRQTPIVVLVLCAVFALYFLVSFGLYYATSDDSYYMARAMEVIAQNRLDISNSLAWLGQEKVVYPVSVDASTLEFFKAYLSYITGIPVTVLCRCGLDLALTVINFSSMLTLTNIMIKDKQYTFSIKVYALMIYMVLILCSIRADSAGMWIICYLWQGKAMLSAIVFPLLLAACATIMRHIEAFKWREWLSVMLVLISGVAISVVGIFLTPILFFLIGLSYMLITKFRYFAKILPCAVVVSIPTILCIGVSYFSIVTENRSYFTRFGELESWLDQLNHGCDRLPLFLFIVCVIYLIRKGSTVERTLFTLTPVMLFVTFANPLLMHLVSTYVTTASVYWRLFWLLPVYILPAYLIPTVIFQYAQPKQVQHHLISIGMVLLLLSGVMDSRVGISCIIPQKNRNFRNNIYNLPPRFIEVADAVLQNWDKEERPVLLCYPMNGIRQYTSDIALACGIRSGQLDYQSEIIPGTDIRENDFYKSYQTITDGQYLHDVLSTLQIDYVYFPKSIAVEDAEQYGFLHVFQDSAVDLWRVNY